MSAPLTWCEVDGEALAHNARVLRGLVGAGARLGVVVKSNAYGHGLVVAARAFLAGGADWLVVQSVDEARALRQAEISAPMLIIGYTQPEDLAEARALGCRVTVYDPAVVEAAALLTASPAEAPLALHLKIETGNYRQGLELADALALADRIRRAPGLALEGISSHFANVEDTTDHSYARQQVARFEAALASFRAAGHPLPLNHMANSAATLLWPEVQYQLCRPGIISYGLWPSPETLVSTILGSRPRVPVRPALAWKARVAQVKDVPQGAFIGYGCTYMATHPTRIAVLPVGYYEGYDRKLSNLAHVLIRGRRAPVRGRVCMNFIMVDVTDIPGVNPGEEAVLLGRQGGELISAETLAGWAGTINYEITARIAGHLPRLLV